MSHVALYRKYRPSDFGGVIGQEHIVATLTNQIKNNKITHAYLFTGTRGTGKTSVAKILAKAINCTSPIDGNACGKCDSCVALSNNNIDIIEMDAASNNGVDYARDIREKVQYPPTTCRYKVYIIDEVHMLSTGAFNALLKTIEEPPAHAVFILCTTEVHKIPATILSRCMRFDFKLIPTPKLAELVASIFDKEGKQYTSDAVYAIAQAGEGSARDSISIADRCYSQSATLTYDDVRAVLGVSSRHSVIEIARGVLTCNIESILVGIHQQIEEGKDVSKLNRDLLMCFQQTLMAKTVANANSMLALPEEAYKDIAQLAECTTLDKLLYAVDSLARLEIELKTALSANMLFEAVLLRIASSNGEVDVMGLDRRITRLEQRNNAIDSHTPLIIDKNDAQSLWKGVKVRLMKDSQKLLVACWEEAQVSIAGNNYVVSLAKGAYELVKNEYYQALSNAVNGISGKTMELKLLAEVQQPKSTDDILSSLGNNVVIK